MASLAVLRRQMLAPVSVPALECECGRPKESEHECCSSCAFLDGVRLHAAYAKNRRADVIAALRIADRLSLTELCGMIYGYANKSTKRMLHRVLHELMDERRVERFLDEEANPISHRGGWRGDSEICGTFECWRYTLVGGAS